MSTVISVEKLSKSYRLGAIGGTTLRDDLSRLWEKMWQKPDPNTSSGHHARHMGQEFWALQDINFQVKDGEILGLIGRNGAGKSTLLKILSRITGPTSGQVKIKGRIASLLEVGTGFHPELTGRENIFLNGTILGMTKAEIRKKFDEIVAFSEIEEFINTPVKRYSSGMYVRLAFAVAAHLEPEILIVDEVLAVGDAQFQQKCLGKMGEVARGGRTVIFVSHNIDAISRLCNTALVLKEGMIDYHGPTAGAVQAYLASLTQMGKPGVWVELPAAKAGKSAAYFHSATYSGKEADAWPVSDDVFWAKVRIVSDARRTVPGMAVILWSQSYQKLINTDSLLIKQPIHLEKGLNEVHVKMNRVHLKPGTYTIGLWLANGSNEVLDYIETAFEIQITDASGKRLQSDVAEDGVVTCEFTLHQLGTIS